MRAAFVYLARLCGILLLVLIGFNIYARIGEEPAVPSPIEAGSIVDADLADGLRYEQAGDFLSAWQLYNEACNRGLAMGCNNVGVMLQTGMAGSPSPDQAVPYFERACRAGVGMACGNLGTLLARTGRPRFDQAEGLALMERGCSIGSASACLKFGRALLPLDQAGLRPDARAATAAFDRGCDLNDPQACENLVRILVEGWGGRTDLSRARRVALRGCQELQNSSSCRALAIDLSGNDRFHLQAVRWLASACRYGDTLACLIGPLLLVSGPRADIPTREERVARLPADCTTGDGDACSEYGQLLSEGLGLPKDMDRAVALFRQGCQLESGDACMRLGALASRGEAIPRDLPTAANLYRKACELDNGEACYRLASATRIGAGVPQNSRAADRLTAQACDMGHQPACIEVAGVLAERSDHSSTSTGMEPEIALLDRGCSAGNSASCREAASLLVRRPGAPVELAQRFERSLGYSRKACEIDGGSNCAVTADPAALNRLRQIREMIARCAAENDMSNCE